MVRRVPHVMVVDDDSDLRESLCDLLSTAGYSVSAAEDGAEALSQLTRARPPDLLVLDIRMPRKSGTEVLLAMRNSMTLIDIPVIVLSADLAQPVLGAVAWLKKPISPDLLLATIAHYLRPAAKTA